VLLAELSNAAGASGNENAVRKLIIPAIKDHVDNLSVDTIGNVYAAKKGTRQTNITAMVTAHMDEVGFMITKITSNGLLKFKPVGAFDPRLLPGKTVLVGRDRLPGVIGLPAIHNLSAGAQKAAPKVSSLVIDIGANSKDQAAAHISLGDYAVFATQYDHLNSDPGNNQAGIVKGKALDNRVGCAMLIELLRQPYPVNLMGIFTVQEEIGGRGAQVAAHRLNPDLAIVLECTTAEDLPVEKGREIHYPRLGDGPCLTIMDRSFIASGKLVNLFEATAAKHNISYQYKKPNMGGTDGGAIHKSRAGIPTVTIAVPSRYIHSPAALIDLVDFWNCIALVENTLKELPEKWIGVFE
jgi:endoglucanase